MFRAELVTDRSFAAAGLRLCVEQFAGQTRRSQLQRIQETTENTHVSIELRRIVTSEYLRLKMFLLTYLLTYLFHVSVLVTYP